jgi:uncharacterized membrane protein YedE/YeeE
VRLSLPEPALAELYSFTCLLIHDNGSVSENKSMNHYFISLLGGVLIGLSAVILLASFGRIAGISGIVWDTVSQPRLSVWRLRLLISVVVGAALFHLLSGSAYPAPSGLSWWQAALGGLLVGSGAKLGGGCTSGHGVCGIARLSRRSIAATLLFMATGMTTVFVIRHLL